MTRLVTVAVSDEHYEMLKQEQAERVRMGHGPCSIGTLAAEALAAGMTDDEGDPRFGRLPELQPVASMRGPTPVDTGHLKASLTLHQRDAQRYRTTG